MLHDVFDGCYVGIKYLPIILKFTNGKKRVSDGDVCQRDFPRMSNFLQRPHHCRATPKTRMRAMRSRRPTQLQLITLLPLHLTMTMMLQRGVTTRGLNPMNNYEEQAVDKEEEGGEAWQRLSKKR
jgi:hypothetical protein